MIAAWAVVVAILCVFCLLSVRGRCCRARKPCNSVAGWLVVGVVAALCPISVPICIGGGIAPKDVHEVAGIVDGVVVGCVGGGGGDDVGTYVDHTGKLSAESATAADELAAAGRVDTAAAQGSVDHTRSVAASSVVAG